MNKAALQMKQEAEQNDQMNNDLSALPEELSTLLQIDLLLGHTAGFQRRLHTALSELSTIADQADSAIKH